MKRGGVTGFPPSHSIEEEYIGQLSFVQHPKADKITQLTINTPTHPEDEYEFRDEKTLFNDQFSKSLQTVLTKLHKSESKLADESAEAENFEQPLVTVTGTSAATKKGTSYADTGST